MLLRSMIALAVAFILSSCASAPVVQKPISAETSDKVELFRSPVLDQFNHTMQHLNDGKDIIYYQTYGGGGVGVGLLGPLGVLANVKMIESATMKDVGILKNKIDVNAEKLFRLSAQKNNIDISVSSDNNAMKLNPYVLVEKTEGDKLMLASVILMKSKTAIPNKYLIQLPVKYTLQELSSLNSTQTQKLNDAVLEGFNQLLVRIKVEKSLPAEPLEKKITAKSEFLTPRFGFELQGSLIEEKSDMVWLRLVGCVCGVMKADVNYNIVKK